MKKNLILSMIFCVSILNGFSQLYFENKTDKTIVYTVGYNDSEGVPTTVGWYYLKAGETQNPGGLYFTEKEETIWYYGYSMDEEYIYKGDKELLIVPNVDFKIQGAHDLSQLQNEPSYRTRKFKEEVCSFSTFDSKIKKITFIPDISAKAKIFFSKYLDAKLFYEFALKSLPTLDECKQIFNDQNAYTYFGYLADAKIAIKEKCNKENGNWGSNYVGLSPLYKVVEGRLNDPDLSFYEVGAQISSDDDSFVVLPASYHWVNLNSKWIFLPGLEDVFGK